MVQSDLMEFTSKASINIFDDEEIKRYILRLHRSIVHAGKIKNRMIKEYDIYLEESEEASLSIRIGLILAKMCADGRIKYYGRTKHHILYFIE